jgi:hypothetical protein
MAKIRQEINILDAQYAVAATTDTLALVQLDTTAYSGTITCYFEAVVSASSSNAANIVKLRRFGTTTDDASIPNSSMTTTLTRIRTAAFTPPTGQTEYFVRIERGAGTVTVNAARIIVIQDSGSDPITATETQIEIGNQETQTTNGTWTPLVFPKYWNFNASNWDGLWRFYYEFSGKRDTSNMSYSLWGLRRDDGTFNNWAQLNYTGQITSTTTARYRVPITGLINGRNYRIDSLDSNNMNGGHVTYNFKIIAQQISLDTIDLSNDYSSQASLWDSTGGSTGVGQSFTGNGKTLSAVRLLLMKSGSPTNTAVVKIYAHSGTFGTSSVPDTSTLLATSDTFSVSTLSASDFEPALFNFTGANQITLNNGTNYVLALEYFGTSSNLIMVRDNSTSTHNGNRCSRGTTLDGLNWSSSPTTDLTFAIISTDSPPGITKIESQYLLLNTGASGTGLQSRQTLFDADEWSGVTNTYKHSHDAANASASTKLTVPPSTDVGSSTVTGTNQQTSSALTLTDDTTIDSNVVNNTDTVASSKIIVETVVTTSGGDKTVNAGTQTTTLALQAPTVTATKNTTITPDTLTLTSALQAPTVSLATNKTVTPTQQTTALALQSPTITAIKNSTQTPTNQATTLSLLAPTVTAIRNATTTQTQQTLTSALLAPTVTAIKNTTQTPNTLTTTLALQAPTITTTKTVTLTPDVISTTLALQSPTIQTDATVSVQVDAGTQALTSALLAPTVTAVKNVSVSQQTQALTSALQVPTVITTKTATTQPTTQTTTLFLQSPTVSAIKNVSVSAGLQTTTLATQAPTVSAIKNATVAAGTQTLTSALPAPTVTAIKNATIAAGLQTTTMAPQAPTVNTTKTATITPNAITSTLQVISPAVSAGGAITTTPTTQTVTLAPLAPTITTTKAVTVSAGLQTITLSQLTPDVVTSKNIAHATTTQTLSLTPLAPTVSTSGSVTVAAGLQSLTLGLFTPSLITEVPIDVTVYPQTIQLGGAKGKKIIYVDGNLAMKLSKFIHMGI